MYRRAADYVDRLARGAKAAELPIEQPRNFELILNLKTAKAIGVTLPTSIVLRTNGDRTSRDRARVDVGPQFSGFAVA
jgi:putative ABC transport system substrate-binding protein